MPKPASALLPQELLAFLRNPLISTRTVQILYNRSARLISKRSRKFLLTAIPAVRRQLRWAMLFALIRAYISFMRRVILDPKSGFERGINRSGGWLLLLAIRERVRARLRRRVEGRTDLNQEGFATPPTSPATSISSGLSYASAPQQIPDYFLRSSGADPILQAIKKVMPDATGYKVVVPQPLTETAIGQENASNELANRISGKAVETKAYCDDGVIRTPPSSESGKEKIVAFVLIENLGDRKRLRGAVTVDAKSQSKVEAKQIEELGLTFAEALDP